MKKIPIFLSSDNNYAPYAAATIASVCDNTRSFVDFYILDSGISEENKTKIENLKEKFPNFSVEFVQIDTAKMFSEIEYKNKANYISFATYNRFLIPYIKPELEKVIYLDVDLIVNLDVEKLYSTSLDEYDIAAVYDTWYNQWLAERNYKNCIFESNHCYFNAGVLLIDCQKWREKNILKKVVETEQKYRNRLRYADQDILNLLYNGSNYKMLDKKYNVVNFIDVLNDTEAILHWAGRVKPWQILPDLKTDSENRMSRNKELFWKYAFKTEYYDELAERVVYRDTKSLKMMFMCEVFRSKIQENI